MVCIQYHMTTRQVLAKNLLKPNTMPNAFLYLRVIALGRLQGPRRTRYHFLAAIRLPLKYNSSDSVR